MNHAPHMSPQHFEYAIRPGDTFSGVLYKMYGVGFRDPRYAGMKDQILLLNPHIRNPDRIRAGDILRLTADAYICRPAPAPVAPALRTPPGGGLLITQDVPPQDREAFWALSWLEHNANYLTISGSVAFGASSNLLSQGNVGLINSMNDLYAQYKTGGLTKGQYDYQRRIRLNQLRANLGPTEKWLFGGKTTHQSIRIARAGGVPATANIAKHAQRLKTLSTLARNGGVVLTGVGLAASCVQIASETSQDKKNDIFVETVASTVVGTLGGALVGVFLISNPIGWGTALVLAAGTAAWSYNAGKFASWAYDVKGRPVDFVKATGVDKLCS
jgi:hypothetical protein